VLLAVTLLLYFHSLARRVDVQTEAMSALVARVVAFTTLTVGESPDSLTQAQFQGVIRELPFPVILTDVMGRPLTWSGQVGARPMSIEELLAEDLEEPSPRLAPVMRSLRRMDGKHAPVPMLEPGTTDTLMFLHYGSPRLAGELRFTPWVTIGVAGLFGIIGLLMVRSLKRATEGFIWAGMAKETAHQLGTPLSSLHGWVEVLRDEVSLDPERASLRRELFEEVIREIDRDTARLGRVAQRFSQIGSQPKLEPQALGPVVQSTLDYFRRRVPEGVVLESSLDARTPSVALNPELFGWVLENLLKNAMNAMDGDRGRVEVTVRPHGKGAVVSVRDFGRGVAPGMEKLIFRPGVSTRQRGWGMGLPLSRRIVEDYHGGRLELARSEPGKGAEFRVTLPPARGEMR
jgi:hypothetical protein